MVYNIILLLYSGMCVTEASVLFDGRIPIAPRALIPFVEMRLECFISSTMSRTELKNVIPKQFEETNCTWLKWININIAVVKSSVCGFYNGKMTFTDLATIKYNFRNLESNIWKLNQNSDKIFTPNIILNYWSCRKKILLFMTNTH